MFWKFLLFLIVDCFFSNFISYPSNNSCSLSYVIRIVKIIIYHCNVEISTSVRYQISLILRFWTLKIVTEHYSNMSKWKGFKNYTVFINLRHFCSTYRMAQISLYVFRMVLFQERKWTYFVPTLISRQAKQIERPRW